MKTVEAKHFLMLLVALGFFGVLGALMFVPVPEANEKYLLMLLMPLASVFQYLAGYKPPEKSPPTDTYR